MVRTPPSGLDGLCVCGSGRPFRACCASRFAADVAPWQRAREAEHRLATWIAEYALLTYGPDLFKDACRLFSLGHHSSESLRKALPVLDPWFAFTWIPNVYDEYEDDVCDVPESWPSAPLGVTWLASESATVSDFDRAFIVTAADSPYSLLLVETVRSGWSLTVRDLLTGRRFLVVDPEISARARPEDILLSAVLTLGGVSSLLGPAPYTLPPDRRVEAMDMRSCYSVAPWLTRTELMGMDLELIGEYRQACDRGPASTLDPGRDAREPVLLRWTVSAPFADVLESLRPLSVCYMDEEAIDLEGGPDGEPRAMITWYEAGPSGEPDDCSAIGLLYLDEGRLAADVPTPQRANRLIAEVAARVGPAATLVEQRPSVSVRLHTRRCSFDP